MQTRTETRALPQESPRHCEAPQRSHSEFSRFLNAAAQVHPALKGEPTFTDEAAIAAGPDNAPVLNDLYAYWQLSSPEGGQPYWSIRCWTMLVWQPVYLAVIGAHVTEALPVLTSIRQKLEQGIVAGFNFSDVRLRRGSQGELIDLAGHELRLLADALFAELSTLTRIRRVSAMRLVADALLSALVQLGQVKPGMDNETVRALADRWLAATGLLGQSDLMPIALASGREQLVLNRKGCCMHYRRDDGDLCASCPKLKMPERLEHLKAEWDQADTDSIQRGVHA